MPYNSKINMEIAKKAILPNMEKILRNLKLNKKITQSVIDLAEGCIEEIGEHDLLGELRETVKRATKGTAKEEGTAKGKTTEDETKTKKEKQSNRREEYLDKIFELSKLEPNRGRTKSEVTEEALLSTGERLGRVRTLMKNRFIEEAKIEAAEFLLSAILLRHVLSNTYCSDEYFMERHQASSYTHFINFAITNRADENTRSVTSQSVKCYQKIGEIAEKMGKDRITEREYQEMTLDLILDAAKLYKGTGGSDAYLEQVYARDCRSNVEKK